MGDMDFKLAGSREGITALQVGRDRKPLFSKLTPPHPCLCSGWVRQRFGNVAF